MRRRPFIAIGRCCEFRLKAAISIEKAALSIENIVKVRPFQSKFAVSTFLAHQTLISKDVSRPTNARVLGVFFLLKLMDLFD